jgi:hypothetical protein
MPVTAPRPFGTDRAESGPGNSCLITCATPKSWVHRRPKTLTSAEHPGTAVKWGEEIFEVMEASPTDGGGMRYRLEPWDARHAIRTVSSYDEASEQARESKRRQTKASIQKRGLSILFAPILGNLPAAVQSRMESEFGAPACAMTIASALPLLVLGLLGVFASQITQFAGEGLFPDWLGEHPFLSIYLALESGLRLFTAFVQREPMGSLLGALLYEIWHGLTGKHRRAASRVSATPAARRWEAEDIYKLLEPLLAFLAPPEQEALERRFGFEFRRWGRFTAVALFVVAVLNVLIALGQFAQNRQSAWDYFWLPAGLYLMFEQARRWRQLAGGRPAGSVLGILIRPISRKLFFPASAA